MYICDIINDHHSRYVTTASNTSHPARITARLPAFHRLFNATERQSVLHKWRKPTKSEALACIWRGPTKPKTRLSSRKRWTSAEPKAVTPDEFCRRQGRSQEPETYSPSSDHRKYSSHSYTSAPGEKPPTSSSQDIQGPSSSSPA